MKRWIPVTCMAALALALAASIYIGLESAEAERAAMTQSAALEQELVGLKRSNRSLQGELESFQTQAIELDRDLGATRQELFKLEQENKRLVAEAAVALDSLTIERAAAAERQEEVVRLRREILAGAPLSPPQVEPAKAVYVATQPPAVVRSAAEVEDVSSKPAASIKAAVLGYTPAQQVVALGYGRRDGAAEHQKVRLSKAQQPLANVVLTAVRADFSIGVVLPDSSAVQLLRRGEVLELILAE